MYASIGEVCVARAPAYTSQAILGIETDKSIADNRFLFQMLQFKKQELLNLGQTGTQSNLNAKIVRNFEISLPPIPEQRRIAAILTDLDDLIEAQEALIAKKEAVKQATMELLLTGKKRLPGFEGEWGEQKFKEVFVIQKNKHLQVKTFEYQVSGLFPIVDQGQKPIAGFSSDSSKVLNKKELGLIVFGDHTCITKFVDFPFIAGADGTQILETVNGNPFFRYLQLSHAPVESTGYNRHLSILRQMIFVSPTLAEQDAIAEFFKPILEESKTLAIGLEKLQNQKLAVMHKLLTGEIRLPEQQEEAEKGLD